MYQCRRIAAMAAAYFSAIIFIAAWRHIMLRGMSGTTPAAVWRGLREHYCEIAL